VPHPELINHNKQFPKGVIDIGEGCWTAVGFAASNVHMIEGSKSITIIDTTESLKAAQNILAEFRKLTTKPIARIIYSHGHRDHISGAHVFYDGSQDIIASYKFTSDLVKSDKNNSTPLLALKKRAAAQFGMGLSSEERINIGCGPGDRPMEGLGEGFINPTTLIEEDKDYDLDGVSARFIHVPGETEDHMVVWLPEKEILFSGDNWYHAFPNLYAIRGTTYRDFGKWADSLKLLADLNPEVLVPGHTLPQFGKEKIRELLETTREMIIFLMEKTAQGLNAGIPLDDIVAEIELPEHLATKPWLKEHYGKLSWSARAYATGLLGWYDGNPTNLDTIGTDERARLMAELAGGLEGLWEKVHATENLQWKLELCDYLIALGEPAKKLKADTMRILAESEINATARNSYLWEADNLDPNY